MMAKDLLLPSGKVLQLGTDRIIDASESLDPFKWDGIDGLSGCGATNVWHPETKQPNYGCPTGAEIVTNQLLIQLARQYLGRKEPGDHDARWAILGGQYRDL